MAAVIAGLLLRMTRIGESLWYDEIASWQVYCAGLRMPWLIMAHFDDPINHVLSNLLLWASVNLLGNWTTVELAFRLPALLFSLLSIVAVAGLAVVAGGAG